MITLNIQAKQFTYYNKNISLYYVLQKNKIIKNEYS